ncbi:MAG TPA: hypothetical protein VG298_00740 [Acidimicrobiales bacterium]|jgi:hypothetical protein|nr:hypothetical protein [Acidimicrobiales bacterium]
MIAVYVSPVALDQDTYERVSRRLEESRAPMAGRSHHSCFGEPGNLMVYEVWETQEAYEAFAAVLLPILAEEGVTSNRPPDIMPVVNLSQ